MTHTEHCLVSDVSRVGLKHAEKKAVEHISRVKVGKRKIAKWLCPTDCSAMVKVLQGQADFCCDCEKLCGCRAVSVAVKE